GLVAGHRNELRDEAHRDLRGAAAQLGAGDVGLVDSDETGLDGLALGLALPDGRFESLVDLAREQIFERTAIAFGISQDNHFIGGTLTGDEMFDVESIVFSGNRTEASP